MHHAGHCVVAHVLGLRVAWVKSPESVCPPLCNLLWHRGTRGTGRLRDVVEADALVALAGVAAQWLYRQGTVGAAHIRRDDSMAAVVLRQVERDEGVEEHWRTYLRQRALQIAAEPQNQLLIARLAGYLVGREHTKGHRIHAFLAREQMNVRALLCRVDATLEERVGLVAHRTFALPIERLGLSAQLARTLRAARIPTLGRLLQYSAHDLRTIVAAEDVERIIDAVAVTGFELAKQPRSNASEVPSAADERQVYPDDSDPCATVSGAP